MPQEIINEDGKAKEQPVDETGKELETKYDSTSNQFGTEENKSLDISGHIPEEFKDRPYLEDVTTLDQVLKKLDGAESLIGKKELEPPKDDAPQEKWEAFYNRLGRPEKVEDYVIEGEDVDFAKKLAPAFHKAGLSNKQVQQLIAESSPILEQLASAQNENFSDEGFNNLTKEVFGDNTDQAIKVSRDLINKFADPKLKDYHKELDNKSLVLLASILNNVHNEYIKTDTTMREAQPESGTETPADLREKAKRLIRKAQDPNTTFSEAENLKKQINEIYASLKIK